MRIALLFLASVATATAQPLELPLYYLVWPELDAASVPTGRWLGDQFQTKSETQAALDLLIPIQREGARAVEITATSVEELPIDEVCRRVIAVFRPQLVECDPKAGWATAAAWSGRSIDAPDDMTAADTQVGATACRWWGPQASTDVFGPGSTPRRGVRE